MSEEILNKYIELINKNYCSDCNELNCIDNFPHKKIANAIRELQQENQQLKEKVEYLKSKIENKDRWCQLIADIGFDYDGYNDSDNLKTLIDELVRYALYSRDDYDYEEFLSEGENDI